MVATTMTGPGRLPASGKPAKQLVVFLHGVGADGDDLISLAPFFAEALQDAEFLSPHAPFPCDMAPYGRQWFSLQDRSPQAIEAGLAKVRPILDDYLDGLLAARGLADQNLALVGFSQGTMLSLYSALRRPKPIAAVLGYSGLLAAPEKLAAEITARPPVLLVHGTHDGVVPFDNLAIAKTMLESVQVPVSVMSRPGLAHSIDEPGLRAGVNFVSSQFAKLQA